MSAPASSLPCFLDRFVGRSSELRALARRLADPGVRLVTLAGPGGVGKTRLAVEAARRAASRFADGTLFVDLARVGSVEEAGASLCQALELPPAPGGDLWASARAALAGRSMLILFDNFETARESTPEVVRLLFHCPRLAALVTSRLPLHALGEQVMRLAPMQVPAANERAESVELFLERASATGAVQPAGDSLAAVAAICRKLDGLPLALELAAARMADLSPESLLASLEAGAHLLDRPFVGTTGRAQSLGEAVRWSYDLLPAELRARLRRLSSFHGRFSPEDAGAVWQAGRPEADLAELCEHSLLQFDPGPGGAESRYHLLEPMRLFAEREAADLDELDTAARSHAERILQCAIREAEAWEGGDSGAPARIAAMQANIIAALQSAERLGLTQIAVGIAQSLGRYWQAFGPYREGVRALGLAVRLAENNVDPALRMEYGILLSLEGEHSLARAAFEAALAGCRTRGDRRGEARALNLLGTACDVLADLDAAETALGGSLALRRELGEELGEAAVRNNLALVARKRGRLDDAERLLLDARAAYERLGQRQRLAVTLSNLAEIRMDQQDVDGAESIHEECRSLCESVGDPRGVATSLAGLGDAARVRGHTERARRLYEQSAAGFQSVGDMRLLADLRERLRSLEPRVEPVGSASSRPLEKPAALAVRMFGGLSLEPSSPGIRLNPWQRKGHRQVFEYLCLHRAPVARAALMEVFWPHLHPDAAAHSLRKALSDIRQAIGPAAAGLDPLCATRDSVCLAPGSWLWVDAAEAASLSREAQEAEARDEPDEAIGLTREAKELMKGDLLPEETAPWVEDERARFHALRAGAAIVLARQALREERWAEAERLAEEALSIDPCLERACRLRMNALARMGRRVEALRAFEACCAALQRELDVSPTPQTARLADQIRLAGADSADMQTGVAWSVAAPRGGSG